MSAPVCYKPKLNNDFTLHQLHGLWHWESQGPIFGKEYCSDNVFETQAEAIEDAATFLAEEYDSLIDSQLPDLAETNL